MIPLVVEFIMFIAISETKILKTNDEDVIKRAIDSTLFTISFRGKINKNTCLEFYERLVVYIFYFSDIFALPVFSLKYSCYAVVAMLAQNFISLSTFKMTSDIVGL